MIGAAILQGHFCFSVSIRASFGAITATDVSCSPVDLQAE